MATSNAARPTGFYGKIGVLGPGLFADAVLLDLSSLEEPYMEPDTYVVDTVLYRSKASHVDTVMIQSEVVVRNGSFIKIDKAEIIREARKYLSQPLNVDTLRARQMAQRLMPFVEEFYRVWRSPADRPH